MTLSGIPTLFKGWDFNLKIFLPEMRDSKKFVYLVSERSFNTTLKEGDPMDTMEDSRIVELFLERDQNAIAHTERKYKSLCFRIAYNILGSREDSDECVNDALLGAWNSIPPNRPQNLKAFICKIARNISLTRLKHNTRQKRNTDLECSLDELAEILPDERLSPDNTDEEIGAVIDAFLDTLDKTTREVFLRKYWFFDKVSDITERFGFSESKINNILYRTRNKLRDYLKKEGIYL